MLREQVGSEETVQHVSSLFGRIQSCISAVEAETVEMDQMIAIKLMTSPSAFMFSFYLKPDGSAIRLFLWG